MLKNKCLLRMPRRFVSEDLTALWVRLGDPSTPAAQPFRQGLRIHQGCYKVWTPKHGVVYRGNLYKYRTPDPIRTLVIINCLSKRIQNQWHNLILEPPGATPCIKWEGDWSRTILIFGQLYGLLYLYYIVFILHQEIILSIQLWQIKTNKMQIKWIRFQAWSETIQGGVGLQESKTLSK